VGDDRFSYFVDFTISVIFESGFIPIPMKRNSIGGRRVYGTIAEARQYPVTDI
jgi:hypothetical protein